MNFVLTPQMIDKIGFAMEDQKGQYAVNVETGGAWSPVSRAGEAVPA